MKIILRKFGKTFSARSIAHNIFDNLNHANLIEIDLKNINEITPSFCHEMIIIFKNKKQNIKIINTSESVKLQLNKALSSLNKNNI